jgi:hypothetical protein
VLRAGGLVLALAGLVLAGTDAQRDREGDGGETFAGTWSVSGIRRDLPVEGGSRSVVVDVSGAVVLTSGEGLSRGFQGRAIGFEDGAGLSVGRCVWTDEKGDQVFSRLRGEALAAGKKFSGTITGGTGRYAGLDGEYAFTWEYLLLAEDDRIHGRAVSLSGRVRHTEPAR